MINSRYRPSFVIISIVLLGIIALILVSAAHSNTALFSIAFFPVLVLFTMWRRFCFLRISPDRLYVYTHFKSRHIAAGDIRSIWLWGRKKVTYGHIDAVTIITADGLTTQLPDHACENMREIRRYLLDHFPAQVRDAPVVAQRPAIGDGHTESFYGNIFLSMNAVPIYLFALIAALANLLGHPPLTGRLIPLMPLGIFWLALGGQLYYFRLTTDTLEIRNQFFPWMRGTWPLDDIDNIVFEFMEGRGTTNILRIHTYDLRSKGYNAIGLKNRHWLALGIALQKRGIPVKNELAGVHLLECEPETPANADSR